MPKQPSDLRSLLVSLDAIANNFNLSKDLKSREFNSFLEKLVQMPV